MANPISERPLRALIDDLANAIRAKDVNAVMTYYAPDILAFDLLPPLQYRGAEAIRNRLSEWFSSFEGPIPCT
jgi:ketosteroid isomerase-like protein